MLGTTGTLLIIVIRFIIQNFTMPAKLFLISKLFSMQYIIGWIYK